MPDPDEGGMNKCGFVHDFRWEGRRGVGSCPESEKEVVAPGVVSGNGEQVRRAFSRNWRCLV